MRFDVINLAVEGYGTDQELLRLENEGLAYHPDVVVLNFCMTTDSAEQRPRYGHRRRARPEAVLHLGGRKVVASPRRAPEAHGPAPDRPMARRRIPSLSPRGRPAPRATPGVPGQAKAREPVRRWPAETYLRLIRRIHEVATVAGRGCSWSYTPTSRPSVAALRCFESLCWTPSSRGSPWWTWASVIGPRGWPSTRSPRLPGPPDAPRPPLRRGGNRGAPGRSRPRVPTERPVATTVVPPRGDPYPHGHRSRSHRWRSGVPRGEELRRGGEKARLGAEREPPPSR